MPINDAIYKNSSIIPQNSQQFSVQALSSTPVNNQPITAALKVLILFGAMMAGLTLFWITRYAVTYLHPKKRDETEAAQSSLPGTQNDRIELKEPLFGQRITINEVSISQVKGEADLTFSELPSLSFSEISEEEILSKQERIIAVNSNYGAVELSALARDGLLPSKKLTLGNVHYFCSKLFKLESHDAVIALVEIGGKVFPRIFYHSNSQGTWRVMPYAAKLPVFEMGPKKIIRYGKGSCETDTQLPIALTCALNDLSETTHNRSYPVGNIVETEVGPRSLKFFVDRIAIEEANCLKEGAPRSFYQQGLEIPFSPDPTDIQMPADKNLWPDFSYKYQFRQSIPHYGLITVKIFRSKDRKLFYMFYEAQDERAFLASIEYVQGVGINTFGVREKILNIEHMDAPLLEHFQQIPTEYYPLVNSPYESHTYYNNWNYVRKLPIIQLYYLEQKRTLPDSL